MKKLPLIVVLVALPATLGLAACERKPPAEPGKPVAAKGRPETQGIRNTEAIGVSGNAIADKVDGALDNVDAAAKAQREAIDAQSQ